MIEYTDCAGVRYIAEPPRSGAPVCSGCAHEPDAGEPSRQGCITSPSCMGFERDDGLNIIWVRREK
jgi:hypothetical protein